jgi:hypothetical protein
MLVYPDPILNIMPSEHIEKPIRDTKMIFKLFEYVNIFVKSINEQDENTRREAKILRREIESKQTPHLS